MTRKRWNRVRVRCTVCEWTGYRYSADCECYDEWGMYCRPESPGPGCPSWVTYPCPKGHLRPGLTNDFLYSRTDSPVVRVRTRPSRRQGMTPLTGEGERRDPVREHISLPSPSPVRGIE